MQRANAAPAPHLEDADKVSVGGRGEQLRRERLVVPVLREELRGVSQSSLFFDALKALITSIPVSLKTMDNALKLRSP
jgi:hypothetical protein